MSLPLTPSKRPLDSSPSESNGKGKSQKSTVVYPQLPALKISPGSVVFRVLCPVSKSGSVIGKGGSIVSQIRQETGAKIRVEEALPGDDERVIVIVGPEKDVEESNEDSKEDEDKDVAEEGDDDTKEEDDSVEEENDESNEDKESAPVEDLQTEKATSVVQKALLLIFERMVEGEPENDEGDEENKKSLFVLRLLVLSTQVGCLLGKGGSVIKQMAAETGAQIRILPRDKLPVGATAVDELVQLTGGVDKVRKALQSVSKQLLENPPRDRDTFPASKPTGPSSTPFGPPVPKPDVHPPQNQNFSAQGAPYATVPHDRGDYQLTGPPPMHKYRENVFPNRMKPFQEVTFRLLCYNEKVGGVIGKGGTIVKALQHDTGCEIKIMESLPGSEDRLITISGPAHPDDRVSAAQDAVLRVQNRIYRATPDISEKNLIARIIVPSNQIGCILGKGGAVIAEMRKFTGAHIRIVPRDKISLCAAENEEVVQISGEFESVQEALLQITTRLQQHHFRDTFPSINHPSHPSFPEQVAPFPSFNGRREHSPPGMYSNLGPFNKFDAGGMPPHGRFHPHDDRSSFAHNIHRPGIPLHGSGRIPPSAPWEHQGIPNSGGPRGMPDYAGGPPQRRMPGFVGGSQAPIITSTTVEVSVPRSVVPSIYGEDGSSLKKIRQISGAKITINEPRPGATDTAIIIHGTPEQTHAAQSLLQAFVMSGATSP